MRMRNGDEVIVRGRRSFWEQNWEQSRERYIGAMKVYVERNAMRPWLTELRRQGSIPLVLFPYDGHNPSGVEMATPSVITCDPRRLTLDMTIPDSDMEGSEKFEQIRQIHQTGEREEDRGPGRAHRAVNGRRRSSSRLCVQVRLSGVFYDRHT